MGLIRCPDCRRKVSKQAIACPRCGCPGDRLHAAKRIGAGRVIGYGLLMLALIAIGQFATADRKVSQPTRTGTRNASTQASTGPTTAVASPRAVVPLPSADDVSTAIAASDDFDLYRQVFIEAAATLIRDGKCSLNQLRENGGWVRSQVYKPQLVYFVYCGTPHVNNRMYLDASTGRLFQ